MNEEIKNVIIETALLLAIAAGVIGLVIMIVGLSTGKENIVDLAYKYGMSAITIGMVFLCIVNWVQKK